MALSSSLESLILEFQENEITEYHIYSNLARRTRVTENRDLLKRIAEDEKQSPGGRWAINRPCRGSCFFV